MTKNTRFSPEVRQRAVRIVRKVRANITHNGLPSVPLHRRSVAHRRPFAPGSVSMNGIPVAVMAGSTPPNASVFQTLARENRELCRNNDILRQASAYFAKAEFDRLWKNNDPGGHAPR